MDLFQKLVADWQPMDGFLIFCGACIWLLGAAFMIWAISDYSRPDPRERKAAKALVQDAENAITDPEGGE